MSTVSVEDSVVFFLWDIFILFLATETIPLPRNNSGADCMGEVISTAPSFLG